MDEPTQFSLNGRVVRFAGSPSTPLLQVLREHCGDASVKIGCSRAVCGSCTVLINGRPGASCALFAYHADGAALMTASAGTPALRVVAEAFADHAAFQCGYCTSGMILLTLALLECQPDPDRATVVEWLSSGICRCTGYAVIVEAVLAAGRMLRETGHV